MDHVTVVKWEEWDEPQPSSAFDRPLIRWPGVVRSFPPIPLLRTLGSEPKPVTDYEVEIEWTLHPAFRPSEDVRRFRDHFRPTSDPLLQPKGEVKEQEEEHERWDF